MDRSFRIDGCGDRLCDLGTMELINVIELCADRRKSERDPRALKRIAVHRGGKDLKLGIDLGDTAKEISDHQTGRIKTYPEVAKATGKENAYTFQIGGSLGDPVHDGVCWQVLPLFDTGKHAGRWNVVALGVLCIADPRVEPCSRKQRNTLTDLLAELCTLLTINPLSVDREGIPYLAGHMELPGGSKDPAKLCPGDLLPMNELRRDVAEIIRDGALQRLLRSGLVL